MTQWMRQWLIAVVTFISFFARSGLSAPELPIIDDMELDVVLSPTRLQQTLKNVPASVTVITADMINDIDALNVADILRLVPGMAVGQETGGEYRIGYHGTNGMVPRRMQVLIDGVSIYHVGWAQVGWVEIPIAVEEISRVEVTRSPSSASYGANSFFAVVNIISKHPDDALGYRFKSTLGSLGTNNDMFAYGGMLGEQTRYRISLQHEENTGYDRNSGFDDSYPIGDAEDSVIVNRVGFRSFTNLDNQSELQLFIRASDADLEDDRGDRNQISFPVNKVFDRFISGQYARDINDHHRLSLNAFVTNFERLREWDSCQRQLLLSSEMRALFNANPDYASDVISGRTPSGGSEEDEQLLAAVNALIDDENYDQDKILCGRVNEDLKEQRVGIELQDTYIVSPSLRFVSGLNIGRDSADSETYLNREVTIDSQRVFANVEYLPSDSTTINLGGMWENEHRHTDGVEFSPRAALNYHINPNHTIRLVYAEAIRTPDMLESERDWSYTLRDMSPAYQDGSTSRLFFFGAKADMELLPERIKSKEISYYASLPEKNVSWDIKLFEEELDDLISEKLQFFDYEPSNNNSARLRGAELQFDYKPTRAWRTYWAYAYMDNESTNFFEKSLNARHSGAAFVSYNINKAWNSSVAYYGSSSISGFSFDRVDWQLQRKIKIGQNERLRLSFKVRHIANNSGFIIDQDYTQQNQYDNDTHYFLTLAWHD